MEYFALISLTFAVCLCTVAAGNFKEQIYQRMCDEDPGFRDGLVKCLNQQPEKEQLVFQLCGSSISNDYANYQSVIGSMCTNVSNAAKAAACLDHLHHLLHYLNESDRHPQQDKEHSDENEEESSESDEEEEGERGKKHKHHQEHEHHHHGHHHSHKDHGHFGIFSEECFRSLYEAYNVTKKPE